MARNNMATKRVHDEAQLVAFAFANGSHLECSLASLDDATIRRLALHGLAQKVGDSYAGAESVSEAEANATQVWEALCRGEWNTKTRGGILAQAIADVMGKDLGEVIATLATMDNPMKAKLRKDPRIAKRILELSTAKISGEGMDLGGIFG